MKKRRFKMTAESDESMFDTPSFMFVGSEKEYQNLKSKNQEQNTHKTTNHNIRKFVITAIIGAIALFGASKLLR